MGDGFLPAHAAPPGGDHRPPAVQGQDGVPLQVQEPLHPPGVDQLLEQGALPFLNEQIHVQKPQAQGLGQHHAHGALAGAGHSDQN